MSASFTFKMHATKKISVAGLGDSRRKDGEGSELSL
jgi:hypothetical protein